MDKTTKSEGYEVVPNRVMDAYRTGGNWRQELREEVARGRDSLDEIARRRAKEAKRERAIG